MKPNELQHYGVKGMRWKHTRGNVKKTSSSTKKSRGGGFSTAPKGGRFGSYHPGQPVPGQPYLVYSDNKGNAMPKASYQQMKQDEKDPLSYTKYALKDLPGDFVDAGQSFLDDIFGVKRKKA